MKKYFLLIAITSFFAVFVQVSDAQETDKEIKRAEKERQKLAEKKEKERLKKPAQVEINAPIEEIGKLLINIFKARNYVVDFPSKRKIGMSLIPQQINSQTATGGLADYKLVISLDEKNGKTKVTINVGMLALDPFGRPTYISLDSDEKIRTGIDQILSAVKKKLEGDNQ